MKTKLHFSIETNQDENVIILDFPFNPIESSKLPLKTEKTKRIIHKANFEDIESLDIQSKKIRKKEEQYLI